MSNQPNDSAKRPSQRGPRLHRIKGDWSLVCMVEGLWFGYSLSSTEAIAGANARTVDDANSVHFHGKIEHAFVRNQFGGRAFELTVTTGEQPAAAKPDDRAILGELTYFTDALRGDMVAMVMPVAAETFAKIEAIASRMTGNLDRHAVIHVGIMGVSEDWVPGTTAQPKIWVHHVVFESSFGIVSG